MLLFISLFLLAIATRAQEIPYMADSVYQFELDYKFQNKPEPENENLLYHQSQKAGKTMLPFVAVNLEFFHLPENAHRIRIITGNGDTKQSHRLKKTSKFNVELGFADDIKDRVSAHTFFIFLETKKKQRLSKIKISISEEGDFYLNDELFGKI